MEQQVVEYTSVWDGGREIKTSAVLNTNTGVLLSIETTDDSEVEVLNEEYIKSPSGESLLVSYNEFLGEYVAVRIYNSAQKAISALQAFALAFGEYVEFVQENLPTVLDKSFIPFKVTSLSNSALNTQINQWYETVTSHLPLESWSVSHLPVTESSSMSDQFCLRIQALADSAIHLVDNFESVLEDGYPFGQDFQELMLQLLDWKSNWFSLLNYTSVKAEEKGD